MQLGFVIDHSRCIGCHACTVACKAENDVQLGSFRTWVKYTERGTYPEVRRSFAVLRCNQCSEAPCIEICPVHALEKRSDGVVDIDPARCIGCKGCMQACPYDALYINEASGTAEKCHFCVHRTERGLAPACAVVCPTEAIIPGDFHDPQSTVSRLKAGGELQARKREAGTGPNVLYREVDPAGIEPQSSHAAGGYLWADQQPGPQLDAQLFEAMEHKAAARTVYDVHHPPVWGGRVSGYLFTKSLSAGALLAGALLLPPFSLGAGMNSASAVLTTGLALLFLLLTNLLLVFDLKRPERFLFILRYANWDSWLTRGAVVLMAYGGLATGLLVAQLMGFEGGGPGWLILSSAVAAALTAAYTAWLFAQAKGRALWMRRGLALGLLVHALVAGSALLLLLLPLTGLPGPSLTILRVALGCSLIAGLLLALSEGLFPPRRREAEFHRAARLVTHGPFARLHWGVGIFLGTVVPLLILVLPGPPGTGMLAAGLALIGLYVEQDTLVRAGQALPIS